MMTEEQKLRDIAPAGNPFRVPEGYFDNLAMYFTFHKTGFGSISFRIWEYMQEGKTNILDIFEGLFKA